MAREQSIAGEECWCKRDSRGESVRGEWAVSSRQRGEGRQSVKDINLDKLWEEGRLEG